MIIYGVGVARIISEMERRRLILRAKERGVEHEATIIEEERKEEYFYGFLSLYEEIRNNNEKSEIKNET